MMRLAGYISALTALGYMLAGCAKEPAPAPLVKAATVSVTVSDFCEIMRRLSPTGKVSWSLTDTAETITQIRRINAAFDKRCVSPSPATPSS